MLYFLTLILLVLQPAVGQDCSCSETGVSNGVDTGVKGCRLASPRARSPTCFVESRGTCPRARASKVHRGASFIRCSVREALLYAAEVDDVESIVIFRRREADFNVTVKIPGEKGDRTLSLLAYAAAHGSFIVVEDLVINDDFVCNVGENVFSAMCSLNDESKCAEDSEKRQAVQHLLSHVYNERCQPRSKETSAVGAPASCGKHPYFVSVRSSFSGGYVHRCGGVLIYPDTVMTAAHCVDGSSGRFDPVLLIESYSRQDGFGSQCFEKEEVRKGVKTVLHYKWSKGRFSRRVGNAFDVALIKLNKPSNKRPVKISTQKKPAFRETLQFVGFGRQSNGGSFSQLLQIQSIRTAKTSTCKKAYAPSGVDNSILCVGGSDKDFCDGDDGGPLIRRRSSGDELVGIAHLKHPSFGCGSKGIPGLYAHAAKLKHWINKQRKKKF